MNPRADGRPDDALRPITLTRGYTEHPAGSVLAEYGNSRVLCTASVTPGVPAHLAGGGRGLLIAQYATLPGAGRVRMERESTSGGPRPRTQEITGLLTRSLLAVTDLAALGENTINIDCDVLAADGGTRTAAITGAYVALSDAVAQLRAAGALADPQPLATSVVAVSVGVVDGRVRLDLADDEDARAEVDFNVVATESGTLVEVTGVGHGATFARSTLEAMLDLAAEGCRQITEIQAAALATALGQ